MEIKLNLSSCIELCRECNVPAVYDTGLCIGHGGLKEMEENDLIGSKIMGKCSECKKEVTLNETIIDNETYYSGCHEKKLIEAVS